MRQQSQWASPTRQRDRLSPRCATALPVDYRSAGVSGRGILTDIAPGGVHVARATASVSLDQNLSLRLWLCRGQLTLELPAVVVRVEETGFAAALPYAGPDLDEVLGFAIRRLIPREHSTPEGSLRLEDLPPTRSEERRQEG